VVDSVSDVIRLRAQDIQPAPELTSAAVDMNFITGISAMDTAEAKRMLILVDIAGMMSSAEMGLLERAR
jgi:purine-binding chemotaxis protein CheW